MTRWLVRGAALVLALVGAVAVFASVTHAEPPVRSARILKPSGREFGQNSPHLAGSSPGYTLLYSFSSDPKDNTYVATFTPDVAAIYAWATVVEENGAASKQFTVDIQFLAPDGSAVDSSWYDKDTGTVKTYPSDAKSFSSENVARKMVKIAGTPNAQATGQWTVNYTVGGKLIATGNFTIGDAADTNQSDSAGAGENALKDAGYNVTEFTEAKGKSGNLFAYVIMLPASKDLYSSDTTQQIVDGLAALRQAFPDSGTLYVFLHYDERYDVAYFADPVDVDAYVKDNDFDKFASNITVDVFDNQEGKYLGKSAKDFINKNFGAGTYQSPPNPPLSKHSNTVGSLRVTVAPSDLPADGVAKAVVTVSVFDKKGLPMPNAEIQFETSGSGEGSIRPRSTSTDETGKADAVFTAGKKNGSVTITATSGGVTGSGVLTIGSGSTDQPADNVMSYLSSQGVNATKVAYLDQAKTTVAVLVDLGTSFKANDLTSPIIYGMAALRLYYPQATTLVVIVPYQTNLLMFPAASDEYDSLTKSLSSAKTEDDKKTAFTNFLSLVFGKSVYVDRNGNKISTFKDFYNKNFTGG